MKILDCTIRDGGYYTNWDFDKRVVDIYIKSMNHLPIEYLEIGYRSNEKKGYLGEYFYLPIYVMERIKTETTKKLVIILDEKDVRVEDAEDLLRPCVGLIDMVRMAIDPKNLERAIGLAKIVKGMGFEVGFNVMYMSTWKDQSNFLELLPQINDIVDYFYMVDSYGGVYPKDVIEIYGLVRAKVSIPIGFHGHNNMEMALINTLTAIDCGAEIVDATILGMGRGAGNLKTELLLTALSAKGVLDFDFNVLSKVVDGFTQLHKEYDWGTNLPYMVAGANSLPQNVVMDLVGKRFYSYNSIIRVLQNQSNGIQDNIELNPFVSSSKTNRVLILGGGPSVKEHSESIKQYLKINPDILLIHASSRNALVFDSVKNKQIFCLVGNEGYRMEEVFQGNLPIDSVCVLPPFPRKMGTYIPKSLIGNSYQLERISFTNKRNENITAVVLEICKLIKAKTIYSAGYDGYKGMMSQMELELFNENNQLFTEFINYEAEITSLTPTDYSVLIQKSIYSFI